MTTLEEDKVRPMQIEDVYSDSFSIQSILNIFWKQKKWRLSAMSREEWDL